MTDLGVRFLPEEAYRFLGRQLRVRSNSQAVLDHLRLVYGRFFVGPAADAAGGDDAPVEIVDDLAQSGEFRLTDAFHAYRLLRTDAYSQFTRQDLRTQEVDLTGFCDAATLLQAGLLGTVAEVVTDHRLFHAGAVSWGGAGFLFPAEPGLGKTTLVLNLVRRGWGFLSDEVGCLSADGLTLVPFPRSLILRPESRNLLGLAGACGTPAPGCDRCAPGGGGATRPGALPAARGEEFADIEAIVPGSLAGPCPLRYVVFLRGFAEAPRLERLGNANALFELLPFSVSRIDDPGRLLFEFAPVLDRLGCYNLVVGGLEETAAMLADLCGTPALGCDRCAPGGGGATMPG